MTPPGAFEPVDALALTLDHDDVAAAQTVSGAPRVGAAVLFGDGMPEVGVWEMTAGAMRDVEVDEVFVVLEGEATVTLGERTIALRPGVVCRLEAGMSTVWEVPRMLRKVYILGDPATDDPDGGRA
ncbi:cupin domain-containing protein [Microbacterium sp. CJ88]|uniref:cupin domain-containing protein n=1 Tax=Microbacterium sp. CJ88 TaxID=3445672 RepID=UPI003F65D85C